MSKKFLSFILSLLIFFVIGGVLVYAQGGNPPISGGNPPAGGGNPLNITLSNPFNCRGVSPCNLFTFLQVIIDSILLPIGGILAVLAFIYSGFLYVMAQGSDTKIKEAHKALLYTAIGTAVLLGSWVLAKVIENTIKQLR